MWAFALPVFLLSIIVLVAGFIGHGVASAQEALYGEPAVRITRAVAWLLVAVAIAGLVYAGWLL